MKRVLFLGLFTGLAVLVLSEDSLSSKYDSVDIDEVLNNQRLYKVYLNCLLGNGKCSPDGKLIKENIPGALQTGCANCSSVQRARANKILNHIIKNNPADFEELKKRYDPDGLFEDVYKNGFKGE